MSRIRALLIAVAISLSLGVSPSVRADEPVSYPNISGEIAIELENDWAYDSDDPTAEFNTIFLKAEPALRLQITEPISIFAGLVFEPVQDAANPGNDRTFDDEGLYVEVLTLNYDTENFSIFGGKFGVNFGIAWDATPGVYGTDLPEEYELTERIGIGGSVTFGDESLGRHTASASTFFIDTSGLAESAFTRRTKTREGDGGAGNTGDFSSFGVALDGGGYKGAPGFRYHVAYVHQGQGAGNTADEDSFVVGGEWAFQATDQIGVTPIAEFVYIDDAEAVANQNRFYLTGGLAVTYGNWNAALAYTRKETDVPAAADVDEEQLQVSGGYAFDFGLSLDIGWKTNRNAGVDTDTFGGLAAYTIEF